MTYVKTFIDIPTAAAAPSKPAEATVFVAASDARPEVKALADYVCSGSNDDVTIEKAISALPAAGGRVVLSEGNYTLGSSIDILKSNVTLEGQGPGTVIKGAIGTSYIIVGNGSTALSNIRICNLKIDAINQTAGYGINFYGSASYPITNSIVENCWIINCLYGDAIILSYSNNNMITGNNCLSGTYGSGIHLSYSTNNIVIGNNCISNDNGIVLSYSNNNTVTGNVCSSNGSYGILLDSSNNNTISGNVCSSNTNGIYFLNSSNNNIVSENNCSSNTNYGIRLDSSNNNTISGNVCSSNSAHGIYIYSSSNNNTVTGNNCSSNSVNGIYFRNSSNNIISGNNCQSNKDYGICLNSSNNNTVTGNVLKDNSQASNNGYDDINIYGSNYNIISSNTIIATATNKSRYAINEVGSNYNIVMGNYCSGQVTGKIKLVGLNSIAMNNLEV